MQDFKRTALTCIAFIAAVLILPLLIYAALRISPQLLSAAKKATSASAKLNMGGEELAKDGANLFSNLGEVFGIGKNEYGLKIINTPSEDFDESLSLYSGSPWAIDMAPDENETPSLEIPVPTPSEEILNALPYPENIEDHDGVIEDIHYSTYTGESFFTLENGGQVRNCTDLTNDTLISESKELPEFEIELNSTEPQVLIYHTHTTESFEPYTRNFYDKDFTCRTTDTSMNIVAVGNAICRQLDAAGIAYVHDTTVHDYPSYNGSYQSSRETVQDILEQYPSIKVVLDIHRDGIEESDGTRLAPIQIVDGKRAAQIMLISCCDDGTMDMPNYLKNFRLATLLQSTAATEYEGLMRPVLFDYRFYNQDLSTGSLLVEVGSHGNSIDEVIYSGELFGKALAQALTSISKS